MLAELGAVGLSWALEPAWDTLFNALLTLLTAGTGALILSRHPFHPVGWLLCVLGLANALTAVLPQGWGLRAAAEGWAGGPAGSGSGCGRSFCRGRWVAILLLFSLVIAGPPLVLRGVAGCRRNRDRRDRLALDPRYRSVFRRRSQPLRRAGLPTDTLFGWA
jgi:hypothetical protein